MNGNISQLRLAVRAVAVEVLAERFEFRNVDLFDVREVWNLRIADDHLLGNAPPHADHLDFGRVRSDVRRWLDGETSLRKWTSTSACVIRPFGPLPCTCCKSTCNSRARRRTAGLACG